MKISGMVEPPIVAAILAPGRALGTLWVIPGTDAVPMKEETVRAAGGADAEIERFRRIARELGYALEQAAVDLDSEARTKESGIFRAHAAMAADEEFHTRVRSAIQEAELAAEQAVTQAAGDICEIFRKSTNPVFAACADDIQDIAGQIRRRLAGERMSVLDTIPEAAGQRPVIALEEIHPSLVLDGKRRGVQAFIVEYGTSFSHAAILAEAFGIPVLRVPALCELEKHTGATVALDAEDRGVLLIEPTESEMALATREHPVPECFSDRDMRRLPVKVWINIATPDEIPKGDWGCVRGVGLYRTETEFMANRAQPPSEEEQFRTYHRLFSACGDRPVTVRCFDIGGDKPVDFMAFGHNHNPQLGLRSLRLSHYHPELFLAQIRALLRAAGRRPLRLLFPMVETPEQWDEARKLTDKALSELRGAGLSVGGDLLCGFMIETPSSLWCLEDLLAMADFASIGTNDLVQFLFGVDRTNPDVAHFYQPEHPVVLRVLKRIASRARAAGKPVTLCGEIAHDPMLLPVLIGLGITEMSVPCRLAPRFAARVKRLKVEECRELAQACWKSSRSSEVRKLLSDWHGEPFAVRPPPRSAHIDPVCGMTVDPASTRFFAHVDEKPVYFCSETCLTQYLKHYETLPPTHSRLPYPDHPDLHPPRSRFQL